MRDVILGEVAANRSRDENINRMRELLQIVLLKILNASPAGSAVAFTGGTALRLLHDMPRFSEDLDFSLIESEKYNFKQLVSFVNKSLTRLSLLAELKEKSKSTVDHLYIRFSGLLYDAGLSPHHDEKLMIRFELDTNPPVGWRTEISLLSDIFTFPILHFDLASSFATKLHACLFRRYAKGRDYYDLMWYLGKKMRPNLLVLQNAIAQTEKKKIVLNNDLLKQTLLAKLSKLDSTQLQNDVAPFLLHPHEIELLDVDLMKQVVSSYDFSPS